MSKVVYNKKSGSVVGKHSHVIFRIREDKLDEVKQLLGIVTPPLREKNMDLTKGVEFRNMPEFRNEDNPVETAPRYEVVFPTEEDRYYFFETLGLPFTKKKSIWFPSRPDHEYKGMMYVTDVVVQPKYPVYIISKGRWDSRYTSKSLEEMGVEYKIVVEPQEYDKYAEVIEPRKILVLPDEYLNKNQGGIPARNFVWSHAVASGHQAHWIMDDNIDGFFRWNKNKRLRIKSGICFKMVEDYLDGCENVAQCGLQYTTFFPEISLHKPLYIKNTRIYSCILQKHDVDLEERWRGRYNEDTDLSLRLLKKGYSTLLFQNFQCGKKQTLTMKGGNADIYAGSGVQQKLESLINQHPDVAKGTIKFGRVHHQVNYDGFKNNKIIHKPVQQIDYPEIRLVPATCGEEDEE